MKAEIRANHARKCALAAFAFAAGLAASAAMPEEEPDIKNGVHGYTPKHYVQPPEPEVCERLERFKDQKLGLMMSQRGSDPCDTGTPSKLGRTIS